ncbi:septal ring lytic transglycosylase RlpA family protein [Thermodesulfatator autotrophicus]|uniref:septal ring lytic transglycosylase RlpA family protein n=1 Tax=Thermodesulfatator autotrophicus TaxID=1795632 RepID=UPI000B319026|nr:septal ring lytic transglycosylase RlpA family protein [Thermodesulfatator autotrophicus]
MSFLASCAPPPQVSKKTYPGKVPPTQKPYRIGGKVYYPLPSAQGYVEVGIASWYGPGFHGKKTASGERYNMYAYTAAHKVLPMGTKVLVTNLENGRQVIVRINDRGPFVKGRIIDLSYAAARALGMHRKGTALVRIQALGESPQTHLVFKGRYYIQVGSFANYANAVKLKEKLKKKFPIIRIEPFSKNGKTFYRVQVLAAQDLQKARMLLSRLEQEFPQAFIVAR